MHNKNYYQPFYAKHMYIAAIHETLGSKFTAVTRDTTYGVQRIFKHDLQDLL